LAAYIRERVQKDTDGSFLTFADANTIAANLRTEAEAGKALTLAAINVVIAAVDVGSALTVDPSFGAVEDILRILSGETYISPQYAIITSAVPTFLNEADRNTLVAAQNVGSNGGTTFVAKGHFLTSLEHGYVGRPTLVDSGILRASAAAGQLAHLASDLVAINPLFTYGAGGTASDIAGNAIPVTGSHAFLYVYDKSGNRIL